MIYSQPIALDGSPLQSRIFGVGTTVLDFTEMHVRVQPLHAAQKGWSDSWYVMVASSELVVNLVASPQYALHYRR